MGLLQKLKSALGLDASGSPSAGTSSPQDVDVTVEREPSTESEDAVKGTETSGEPSAVEPESTESLEEDAEETSTDDVEEADSENVDSEDAEDIDSEDEIPENGTEAVETVEDVTSSDDDAPVIEINGIGPAYAERLENEGISTVSELAGADAEELGEATDLSPNRISGWIEQANSF
jgi:predicted flap endonuclease-1-like 5' DNA nuclease